MCRREWVGFLFLTLLYKRSRHVIQQWLQVNNIAASKKKRESIFSLVGPKQSNPISLMGQTILKREVLKNALFWYNDNQWLCCNFNLYLKIYTINKCRVKTNEAHHLWYILLNGIKNCFILQFLIFFGTMIIFFFFVQKRDIIDKKETDYKRTHLCVALLILSQPHKFFFFGNLVQLHWNILSNQWFY